jgi:DNA polymerase elongation subunit (family B)
MKLLILDCETAPNIGHVWGLWQQNISLSQLMESGYLLCWAAKWLGEKGVYFNSLQHSSPKVMLSKIHELLDEADAVITYNGERFDIPTLNKEFLLAGMAPPSPYKQIDLLKVVKSRFRFPSNKLEYVCKALGVGQKMKHIGHELWTLCMAGDRAAWSMMEEYNKNDVVILEEVYFKTLPWIKSHANHGLYQDEKEVCPNCGSTNHQKRGFAYTLTNKYQRYQCKDCHFWFRDNKAYDKPGRKFVTIN